MYCHGIVLFVFLQGITLGKGALQLVGTADGFTFYTDFENGYKTWSMARDFCLEQGMYFASTDTERKSNLAETFVLANVENMVGFWVSGTDTDNEGNYYWDTSGRYFTYTDWHPQISPPELIDPEVNCVRIGTNINTDVPVFWAPTKCSSRYTPLCQA